MARQDNRQRPIVQARQDNRKRKIVQASESANSNAFYKRFFLASWWPYLWILAICFLIYGHTIFYDFTYLDDAPLVVDNSYFNSNISNLIHAFQKDVFLTNTPAYRPLLSISFIIDAQIGHTSPQIYHFSNILFHMLASCCVFLLLTQLKYHRLTAFLFTVGF